MNNRCSDFFSIYKPLIIAIIFSYNLETKKINKKIDKYFGKKLLRITEHL